MGLLTDWLNRKVINAEMDVVTSKTMEVIYFKDLALHIAKSYIANAISKCEFKVFENGEEVKDELYYALNVDPNPNQSSSQFLNKLINTLYDKNECLVIPQNDNLYIADNFSIEEKPLKENVFKSISVENALIKKTFKASEVFYFKLDDTGVKKLIDNLYSTYGQLFACAVSAYKRRNGGKYKLLLESVRAGDKEFNEKFNHVIKQQLQDFMENDNAVYPQYKGTDLQEFSTNSGQNADDVLRIRREIFEMTAQALRIPLPMMYGNITNMNEIVKVFLSFCIDPLADMLGEELTRKTNTFKTWDSGRKFIMVDTTRINHIDILEIAEKADKLIASGTLSVDEVREVLDRQPLNTEFSKKHWITKNYTSAEQEAGAGDEQN